MNARLTGVVGADFDDRSEAEADELERAGLARIGFLPFERDPMRRCPSCGLLFSDVRERGQTRGACDECLFGTEPMPMQGRWRRGSGFRGRW